MRKYKLHSHHVPNHWSMVTTDLALQRQITHSELTCGRFTFSSTVYHRYKRIPVISDSRRYNVTTSVRSICPPMADQAHVECNITNSHHRRMLPISLCGITVSNVFVSLLSWALLSPLNVLSQRYFNSPDTDGSCRIESRVRRTSLHSVTKD